MPIERTLYPLESSHSIVDWLVNTLPLWVIVFLVKLLVLVASILVLIHRRVLELGRPNG
jgi:hypothetical protein